MSKAKVIYPFVVSVTGGATVNIGNYESRRISFGLSIPVYDRKKIKKVFNQAKTFVEKEIEKEVKRIKDEHGEKDIEVIVEEAV